MRQQQLVEDDVDDLNDQPAGDGVGDGRLDDAASLHAFEQRQLWQAVVRRGPGRCDEGLVRRGLGSHDKTVTAARQCLDEARVVRTVPEGMTDLGHGMAQCFRAALARPPDGLQQNGALHDLAGLFGQAQQDLCRLRRKVRSAGAIAHLARQGLDEQVTQKKSLQKIDLHAASPQCLDR